MRFDVLEPAESFLKLRIQQRSVYVCGIRAGLALRMQLLHEGS
jgi:hypothetical protein